MRRSLTTIAIAIISFTSYGQGNNFLNDNNWLIEQLEINDIRTSESEFELLIFLGRGFTNGGHLIHLKNNESEWTGNKYDYYLHINESGEVINRVEKFTITGLQPKSTWDSLLIKLESNNIYSLPDQEKLKDKLRTEVQTQRGKGYKVISVMDGEPYDVIVKSKDQIIQYSFHSPWTYLEHFPEVDELTRYSNLIAILENEFLITFR